MQRLPAQRGLEAHLVQRHPDRLAPPGARAEEGVPERTREHGHAQLADHLVRVRVRVRVGGEHGHAQRAEHLPRGIEHGQLGAQHVAAVAQQLAQREPRDPEQPAAAHVAHSARAHLELHRRPRAATQRVLEPHGGRAARGHVRL